MERLKILVVDDESRMRKLIKDFLVKNGYEVLEAENGEQAVDIFFMVKDIALIILDVMMPRMDGYEFTHILREGGNTLPILMVTAKETPAEETPTEETPAEETPAEKGGTLKSEPERHGAVTVRNVPSTQSRKKAPTGVNL